MTRTFGGTGWTLDDIRDALLVVEDLADEYGLPIYRNHVEIVDQRRMFELLSVSGLPVHYNHWSFGKRYEELRDDWRRGDRGMVYELVINSDPCRSFLLDVNTLAVQITVLAHAAVGHNAFFRCNRVFREAPRPDFIVDYCAFAAEYVRECEKRYGIERVERVLDRAHTLRNVGMARPIGRRDRREEEERERREREMRERAHSAFWRDALPAGVGDDHDEDDDRTIRGDLAGLEQNILYWIEKNALQLEEWEREILRIVRVIAQYFAPNMATKLVNEGVATWVHHEFMRVLRDRGIVDDGIYQEFMCEHAGVVHQSPWNHPSPSINPYAIGCDLVAEAVRIATEPEPGDERYAPDVVGRGRDVALREILEWHTSETLIRQFLTPRLLKKWKMFVLRDDPDADHYLVTAIHDEEGLREIREQLARSWDPFEWMPDVRVLGTSKRGTTLDLVHLARGGARLHERDTPVVLAAIRDLWGGAVRLRSIDPESGAVVASHTIAEPDD